MTEFCERNAINMASTERDHSVEFKFYCGVSGYNGKAWASHVFAWRLEQGDAPVCSNEGTGPALIPGSIDKGFYAALLEALPHVPEGGVVKVIAPRGSELYWVFKEPLEDRQRGGYRKKSKKGKTLRPNHEAQRQVDALCIQRGIALTADEPRSNHEIEGRYGVEDAAKHRLRDACEAAERA